MSGTSVYEHILVFISGSVQRQDRYTVDTFYGVFWWIEFQAIYNFLFFYSQKSV